jgi:HrpA-like RNA helicase
MTQLFTKADREAAQSFLTRINKLASDLAADAPPPAQPNTTQKNGVQSPPPPVVSALPVNSNGSGASSVKASASIGSSTSSSKTLPINSYRNEILDTISRSSVTLIRGETGSGKSTQVPKFILEEASRNGSSCSVLVTQVSVHISHPMYHPHFLLVNH